MILSPIFGEFMDFSVLVDFKGTLTSNRFVMGISELTTPGFGLTQSQPKSQYEQATCHSGAGRGR